MKAFLRRLNDLPIFDPGRVPGREIIARVVGCLAIGAFVLRRVLQLQSWPGYISDVEWARPWFQKLAFLPKALVAAPFDLEAYYRWHGYSSAQIRTLWTLELLVWCAETGILLAYVLALLTRAPARSVAKGFVETVLPLLMAGLPFVITMTGYTYPKWFPEKSQLHLAGLLAADGILFTFGTLNVIGLLTLRRAFTIMSEARELITRGPYRFVRHPLYAAHFMIFLVYMLLHFSALTATLYVVFVSGQALRAVIEERKLTAAFPEYEEYRKRTGMFFPKLWRPRPGP